LTSEYFNMNQSIHDPVFLLIYYINIDY